MKTEEKRPQIRFFNDDDGTEIFATAIRIELPNNLSFLVHAKSGRDASAVFSISDIKLLDKTVSGFLIEPGASNLFSVNILKYETTEAQA